MVDKGLHSKKGRSVYHTLYSIFELMISFHSKGLLVCLFLLMKNLPHQTVYASIHNRLLPLLYCAVYLP